ncbi:MAG: prepilin-type N-terminal cleavage/methylation domain-containing protein [Oscillospiraceae bacterium]|nr:prepilin-type N-terminal cleavage/methylation domain-containing protein [Oscillospiraceae bacterium]
MKKNNKGFTLAELLIVVAIIAVLVAIAIPIFTSQLEKSREATDAANIRDYYAEISTQLLVDPTFTDNTDVTGAHDTITLSGGKTATYATATGGFTIEVADVASKQTQKEWQIGDVEVGGFTVTAATDYCGNDTITYTFTIAAANAGGNTYLSAIAFS